MQFEEFKVGQMIELGSVTVSEEEILAFARAYDPQPFHTDAEFARKSRWGGLIASGWHTCALAMRLACEGLLAGSGSIGSPGIDELRWLQPVRPGDRLSLRIEVLEARRSKSRGGIGILRARWHVYNQEQREVLSMVGVSLFEVRTPQ